MKTNKLIVAFAIAVLCCLSNLLLADSSLKSQSTARQSSRAYQEAQTMPVITNEVEYAEFVKRNDRLSTLPSQNTLTESNAASGIKRQSQSSSSRVK